MQASQRARSNHALEFARGEGQRARETAGRPLRPDARFPRSQRPALRCSCSRDSRRRGRDARQARRPAWSSGSARPEAGRADLGRRAALVVVDARISAGRAGVAGGRPPRGPRMPARRGRIERRRPRDDGLPQGRILARPPSGPRSVACSKRFLVPLKHDRLKKDSLGLRFDSLDLRDPDSGPGRPSPVDRSVGPGVVQGRGVHAPGALLADFVENKLDDYPEARNDPAWTANPNLSPYLHFGQISPLEVALAVKERGGPGRGRLPRGAHRPPRAFHELRPLQSRTMTGTPGFRPGAGRRSPSTAKVRREYVYDSGPNSRGARTHDPYWNAAQKEMVLTGKMHGYMRMYWGKKILEWSRDAGRGLPDGAPPQQQVRTRRPRPQRLRRRRLVLRQARPALGPERPDLRHRPLHERRRPPAEVRRRRLCPQGRSPCHPPVRAYPYGDLPRRRARTLLLAFSPVLRDKGPDEGARMPNHAGRDLEEGRTASRNARSHRPQTDGEARVTVMDYDEAACRGEGGHERRGVLPVPGHPDRHLDQRGRAPRGRPHRAARRPLRISIPSSSRTSSTRPSGPKIEDYGDYLFLVLKVFVPATAGPTRRCSRSAWSSGRTSSSLSRRRIAAIFDDREGPDPQGEGAAPEARGRLPGLRPHRRHRGQLFRGPGEARRGGRGPRGRAGRRPRSGRSSSGSTT